MKDANGITLCIGDRVRMIEDYRPGLKVGDTGTIASIGESIGIVVNWDEYGKCKHDCDGLVPNGHGWYVSSYMIELISAVDLGEFQVLDKEIGMNSLFEGL